MECKRSSSAHTERTYAEYQEVEHLSFDPLADLNLPASYEEVVQRYNRLRAEKQAPGMN